MSSKQVWAMVWLVVVSVLLVACAGEPFAEAYTARGTADHIKDLEITDGFDTTENLQVVIRFNQHTKELRLETLWTDPEGAETGELQATIPADAEIITVAFDLERAGLQYWQPGEWAVEIRIDGKLETTLAFNVAGEITEEALQETEADDTESGDDDGGFDVDNPTNPFGN